MADESDATDGAPAASLPFDGPVLLIASAKASVPPDRLPVLLRRAQTHLRDGRDRYERRFERVVSTRDRAVFLVPADHWSAVGDRLGFDRRETDAVRRTHEEQLHRLGSDLGRSEEFEAALDIRQAVVIGLPAAEPAEEQS